MFHFIVDELLSRESTYAHMSHKIRPVRVFLENNRENFLKFVEEIDRNCEEISREFEVNLLDIRAIYKIQGHPSSSQHRWERYSHLRSRLGHKFHAVESRIKDVLENVVRASSIVENLNSRLRNYFSLRKQLGKDYLVILQFFLNHRRFMRSKHEERVGKSPKEVLTKQKHNHWLELLGFELFKQAA